MLKTSMVKFRKLIFWGWNLYKVLAFAAGTLVFLYIIVALSLFLFRPKVYGFEIPLQSGFVYHYDMQDGSLDGHHLEDKQGKVIVYSDVIRFVESSKTIYGYRKDLHDNPFYFICDYGGDCTDTQNLTDVELRKIIKERNLPLYTDNTGMGRYDFKHEIEQFYKKIGRRATPEWNYDATWKKYRIIGEKDD
jgi:hypothetical protein